MEEFALLYIKLKIRYYLKNSENIYENANILDIIIKSKIKMNIFLLIFLLCKYLDKIFAFFIAHN
jgi:hypothetical protein